MVDIDDLIIDGESIGSSLTFDSVVDGENHLNIMGTGNWFESNINKNQAKQIIAHLGEVFDMSNKAPTDNGIEVLDNLCAEYNKGELTLSALVCSIWNEALMAGNNL